MNRKRLLTVLRVRELQERRARGEVVRARHALAERERAELEARALVTERSGPRNAPASGGGLAARHHMLTAGVTHIALRRGDVVAAVDEVDTATTSWQREAERLDGIERLDERLAEHEREEMTRAEAAVVDDLVIARWSSDSDADVLGEPADDLGHRGPS